MADDLPADPSVAPSIEDQVAAEYNKRGLAAQVAAEYEKRYGGGPEHGSMLSGIAGAAIHSATLHGDSYFTDPEWQKKNENFAKKHPIGAGTGEALGIIGGMVGSAYLPGAQATLPARAGVAASRLGRLAEYLNPFQNFAKAAAPGVTWKEAAKQGAIGSTKFGMETRFNDPLKGKEKPADPTGDPTIDLPENFVARAKKAADLPSMAWDAVGGGVGAPVGNAVGGYIGNRLGELGKAATLGGLPQRGAVLDLKHEIERDSPQGIDATIKTIKDLVYGENKTLARHGAGQIPQEEERALARRFQRLTTQGNLSDAQAEQQMAAYLSGRANQAVTNRAAANPALQPRPAPNFAGPMPPRDSWMLNGAAPYAPGTLGGWARTVGGAYRDRNAVPSNLTELIALANGGEAAATQTTTRKLLNLKSDGPERSNFLRGLRERQKAIAGQMEAVGRRFLGNGNVGDAIAEHVTNAQNANALYPGMYADLAKVPDANQRLSTALRPIIESAQNRLGREPDAISRKVLTETEKFLNPVEVQGAGAEVPLTKRLTENIKDEAGKIVGATQREVPMTRITPYGDEVTTKFNPGGKITEWSPSGDLESIIRRRKALGDEIKIAQRSGASDLAGELTRFKEQMDTALRGLGNQGDDFGKAMAKWATANDTRATAGQLERTYKEALGLNMMAKKGESLVDLARFHQRFQAMDPANQDMARRGIMGQFKALLETGGDTHDAAKIFSNPRTRQMLTDIIGEDATAEFAGFVARAGLATNTFNMNRGAHTASILDADKGSGLLESIWGALYHGNPLRAIGHMGEAAGDAMKRKKHAQMTGMLSTDTNNPAQLERVLANLRRASAPIDPRLERLGPQGRTVGTGLGVELGKRRDE